MTAVHVWRPILKKSVADQRKKFNIEQIMGMFIYGYRQPDIISYLNYKYIVVSSI